MQRHVSSPKEYLKAVPADQLPLLEHCRALIREAAPSAREEIRWGALCYDDGGALFGLAAQKHYVGLYVMATQALKDMQKELAGIDHGKGCLRFRTLAAVPTDTIRRLLTHAKSLAERECKKTREEMGRSP
jgi:uncharacterized protein YdhG (YjbR/CyaY superfamily)